MKKIVAIALFFVCSATFALNLHAITVKKSSPDFSIRIPGNPTTGYSWFLKSYDRHLVKLASYKFLPSKDKHLIGAGGTFVFSFKMLPEAFLFPTETTISFTYARPWLNRDYETRSYAVRTSVDSSTH